MRTVSTCGLAVLTAGLVWTTMTSCQNARMPPSTGEEAASSMEIADTLNMLTPDEEAEGWMLLFDGTTFDGWRGYRSESVPSGWVVQDAALHFSGEGGRGDIITEEQFESFELRLDWKISEGGNSGVMFHVTEEHEVPYASGPEVQVLDNTGHPDAANGPTRQAGANYDMHAPSQDVTKPAGQWNHLRLVVDGPHVEHWLNGAKIVEYELWSDAWKERVATSKWKDYPAYGLAESGHIDLQDHGDPVWYRNIKIRRLSDAD